MRIQITQKLRPFSHQPGTCCLIPFTTWEVQIFPAKLQFRNLAGAGKEEKNLPIFGPVKNFTALLDLEKGRVEVFGHGKKGYFRYFISPKEYPFLKGEKLPLSKKRLFFGVHKKQDWDAIHSRSQMGEVFPFWVRLAALIPAKPFASVGTGNLLEQGLLEETFQAGFQGILSPRLEDENHLGLVPEEKTSKSPIGLIHEGAKQIEELFFLDDQNSWHFLPSLPKELHSGRFVFVDTKEGDLVHFEWSKKELKKVIIDPVKTRSIKLSLQSRLKSFRVRKSLRQKGERMSRASSLDLVKGQRIYLDRFMH